MSGQELAPVVLALLCRACRNALPAARHDVAFRCPRCGRAWEIESRSLAPRESFFVAPPGAAQGRLLYLPYWSFAATVRARPLERDPGTSSAADRAAAFQRLFVAAYAVHRPGYLGEWGPSYTRKPPDWEVRAGPGPDAPGAAIPSDDARAIGEAHVLSEIDRGADLSRLEVELNLGDPELWAIPSLDLGKRLRCPWTRAELPATALDDLSEIRTALQEREA